MTQSTTQGEQSNSPDLTDTSTENIKKNLKETMFGTSVTIVVISPNLIQSKWIDWEIEYSLKEISRDGRTSKTNGILGVAMKIDGSYDWLIKNTMKDDGHSTRYIDDTKIYQVINTNRYNLQTVNRYTYDYCKTYSQLDGSYISIIEEEGFINDPASILKMLMLNLRSCPIIN